MLAGGDTRQAGGVRRLAMAQEVVSRHQFVENVSCKPQHARDTIKPLLTSSTQISAADEVDEGVRRLILQRTSYCTKKDAVAI